MATKKPAKIASQKKGKAHGRTCPECEGEMSMARVLRVHASSGMFWLCQNNSCNALVTVSSAQAGKLEI